MLCYVFACIRTACLLSVAASSSYSRESYLDGCVCSFPHITGVLAVSSVSFPPFPFSLLSPFLEHKMQSYCGSRSCSSQSSTLRLVLALQMQAVLFQWMHHAHHSIIIIIIIIFKVDFLFSQSHQTGTHFANKTKAEDFHLAVEAVQKDQGLNNNKLMTLSARFIAFTLFTWEPCIGRLERERCCWSCWRHHQPIYSC